LITLGLEVVLTGLNGMGLPTTPELIVCLTNVFAPIANKVIFSNDPGATLSLELNAKARKEIATCGADAILALGLEKKLLGIVFSTASALLDLVKVTMAHGPFLDDLIKYLQAAPLTIRACRLGDGTYEPAPGDCPLTAVTWSVSGSGSVNASPSGGQYAPKTTVTLTATPATGSHFVSWGGVCAFAGTSPTCVLTVGTTALLATAVFEVDGSGGGGGTPHTTPQIAGGWSFDTGIRTNCAGTYVAGQIAIGAGSWTMTLQMCVAGTQADGSTVWGLSPISDHGTWTTLGGPYEGATAGNFVATQFPGAFFGQGGTFEVSPGVYGMGLFFINRWR
jgi:hypothetical protein